MRRLREKTDPPGQKIYARIFGLGVKSFDSTAVNRKPLAGYISDTDLQVAKQIEGQMGQARLFGEIIDDDHGKTRLHCFVGVHPVVVAFFALWFSLLFLAFVRTGPDTIITINFFGWHRVVRGGWAAWANPLFMLAVGVGLVGWCRNLARNEKEFLTDFVRQTLEADANE
ncbi:MAG TPA: hypothetical protein VH684_20760 [Xanthobacteraceae bacterium]|jgi:hypothetical protein